MTEGIEGLGLGDAAVAMPSGPSEPRRRLSETPVLLLWAILTVAAAAYVLTGAEHRSLRDPIQRFARGDLTAASPEAMFHRANLAIAIPLIRSAMKPGEQVSSLKATVDEVSVTAIDRFDNRRELRVDLEHKLHTQSFFQSSGSRAPLAAVDISAPSRLLAGVRRKVRAGTPDTFTFSASTPPGWTLELKGRNLRVADQQWIGDAHGRDAHRPGETTPTQIRQGERLGRCLAKAQTPAARQRCQR